jgi:hypothetical protein
MKTTNYDIIDYKSGAIITENASQQDIETFEKKQYISIIGMLIVILTLKK